MTNPITYHVGGPPTGIKTAVRRRAPRWLPAVAAVVIFGSGIGAGIIIDQAATSGTSNSAAAMASSSPSPAPIVPGPTAFAQSPTAAPTGNNGGVLALGKWATTVDGSGTATVYGYKQPVATSAPRPQTGGLVWGAADVKVCVRVDTTVSNSPWTLVYGDAGQIEPSNLGYNQFPTPGYPFGDKTLNTGHCVRGWIVFPVPKDKRPIMVEYARDDGTEIDWKI